MPAPIPVVAPIADLLSLPVGGTVALSGSGGAPGALYQWTLIEKPDGSAAQLNNASTANPTLVGVDTRGTYIVFLKITDSGGSSHPYPYPTQSTSAPYAFAAPLATAFGVVRVAEESGLFKPGRGEYGWFEKGLWPIIDKVASGLGFIHYDEPTHTLDADAIVPSTEAYVDVNTLSVTQVGSDTQLGSTGGKILIPSEVEVTSPFGLTTSAGPLKTDELASASGGNIEVSDPLQVASIVSPATAGLSVTSVGEMLLDSAAGVTVQAATAIDLSAQGLLAMASATGNVEVTAAADITLTATDDITLIASDDVLLTATDDIRLTATDDIILDAGGDLVLESVATATLVAGNTSTGVATVYGRKNTAGTDSVVIRAEARIKLMPVTDTYSAKPVRAPGLVGFATDAVNSTTSIAANPASPYYDLLLKPVAFTRHVLGSRLELDVTVLGVVNRQPIVVRIVRQTQVAGSVTLNSITSHTPSIDGASLVMRVRVSTSLCPDYRVLTHIQADIGDQAGVLHETLHKFTTETLAANDVAGAINFYVQFDRATTTYLQHAAQVTGSLYAAHSEDVI
jgi:hypothetical protein